MSFLMGRFDRRMDEYKEAMQPFVSEQARNSLEISMKAAATRVGRRGQQDFKNARVNERTMGK